MMMYYRFMWMSFHIAPPKGYVILPNLKVMPKREIFSFRNGIRINSRGFNF